MSRRILAVVEGHTEVSVLEYTVAAHLGALGVDFRAKIVGRPGHKGGVYRSFASVAKEIANLFKQEPQAAVTTFFDFYAMPEDWPGVAEAKRAKQQGLRTGDIAAIVERALAETIGEQTRDLPPITFIPYVQMHELESLLFAGPQEMAEVFTQPGLEVRFAAIVAECGGCEEINDRPEYAPSKRIENLFPRYRKGRDKNKTEHQRPHAPSIAKRIGIERLRKSCPHFSEWVGKLEQLAQPSERP